MSILLDTHVLVWWAARSRLLSARALTAIKDATTIFVSPVSCWEVARLHARGRIILSAEPRAWIRTLFEQDRIEVAQLNPSAAVAAADLDEDFPGDPVDRLLYGTAGDLRLPLVTRDRAIRSYATSHRDVHVIW